jgi:hypothetical protein
MNDEMYAFGQGEGIGEAVAQIAGNRIFKLGTARRVVDDHTYQAVVGERDEARSALRQIAAFTKDTSVLALALAAGRQS